MSSNKKKKKTPVAGLDYRDSLFTLIRIGKGPYTPKLLQL